jgi:hypothetical protein
MTTASFVTITCQTCGLASTVPVDALLVSVAVDDHRSATGAPDADQHVSADGFDSAGTVAWTCDSCADLTTAQLDWAALLTLVTAGASVLDDATEDAHANLPPHPEQPAAGAPLNHDDLLALHELLATETWFDQVTTARCVNP